MAKVKTPGGRRSGGGRTPTGDDTVSVETPEAKKRTSPLQFFAQVQAEGRKIVWPSRKETWITSVMVFIMVLIAALFFFVVDFGLSAISQRILAIGS